MPFQRPLTSSSSSRIPHSYNFFKKLMAERKVGLKAKAAMRVAALTLFFAQIACGGAPKIDPCDEAFFALQTAFSGSSLAAGNITENLIEINPSLPGISTHPNVLTDGGEKNWADVVLHIDLDCKDNYSVNYAGEGLERFTEGVTVRRKSTQNFSLPESNPNWVNGMLVAAAAVLGISALFGTKKLIAA